MKKCGCAICENRIDFQLPTDLLDRIANRKCVLFVGAGVSTENKIAAKTTLYEEIQHELGAATNIDFPSLMSSYCRQPDGRIRLLKKIQDRIEYFRSFRGFYAPMTSFHRALRPLFMIEDVITTNWDDFLEIEAGYEAFVYDQDIALIETSRRRLIKIHGSLTNRGSIVATNEDYGKALRRLKNGPLGAYLKTLLSTKTLIYIGYSLKDPNYMNILQSMNKIMGNFARDSYFVSPFIDKDHLRNTRLKIIPIETDGAYFLEQIREHYNNTCSPFSSIISEESFERCLQLLYDVNDLHAQTVDQFLATKNSLLILALSYQDGLQDALMRIKDTRNKGEYYEESRVRSLLHGYEHKTEEYLAKEDFWNACYCRGYFNGLLYLIADDDDGYPPAVDVCFDDDLNTIAKLKRYPRKKVPAAVRADVNKINSMLADETIPEHMPYV